jgi:hypothetical protein
MTTNPPHVNGRTVLARCASVIALVVLGLMASGTPAQAIEPCVNRGTNIGGGGAMNMGECLRSSNGAYTLVMQRDGNLVLYATRDGGIACWASNTVGRGVQMRVHVNRFTSDYVETTMQLQLSSWPWVRSWTYGNVEPPFADYSYNVSINNSGQLWIGWDRHASC